MTAATPDVAALLAQVVQLLASAPSAVPGPRPRTLPARVLLTVEEAAEQLGIGRTTAWALVRSGELSSVQIGRLRRVHTDAIRTYANQLTGVTSHG